MKICIGMISYLPNNEIREKRIKSIQELFLKLDELFYDIPVMVVSQSWGDYEPDTKLNLIRDDYAIPLGIINARIRLRELFLKSDYDYMIMLDDDCIIEGSSARKYLKEIDDHPDGFGWFSNHLLKLFAISKNIYSQIEMPHIDAESFEGFEDKLFISMCRIRFPDYEFEFSHDELKEISYETHKTPSTWWSKEAAENRKAMIDKTDNMILDYMRQYNNTTFVIPGSEHKSLKLPSAIKVVNNKTVSDNDSKDLKKFNFSLPTTEKVDIVVSYVNSKDVKWQESFINAKKAEDVDVREQTASDVRFRDTGAFRYFFRGIQYNCKWVNNVFLIVQDEGQVPDWINTKCNKLKIVYHRDYIPAELLPTFNSNVIEMFLSNIDELSNNYILCNDDTFFLSSVSETMFFEKNKPVYMKLRQGKVRPYDDFFSTLYNNQTLLERVLGENISSFWHAHLQMPHKKVVEKYFLENYYDEIINGFKDSKFRSPKNYTPWLYDDFIKCSNLGVNRPNLYSSSKNVTLSDNIDYNKYKYFKLLCVNDTKNTQNFKEACIKLIAFLDSKFPSKSVFEK